MKNYLKKLNSLIFNGKNGEFLKKCLKKSAFMLDMKRRNKFIMFFALFFIAAYLCMPSMEGIVKKLVNKYGSEITGTDVSIKSLNLKLTSGQGSVKGITIKNPRQYKSKYLFSLDEIGIGIDISSLTEDTIVIENISVTKPIITYEMLSLTQNNISDILNNIAANTSKSESKEEKKVEKDSKASSKKVVIKKLVVSGGEIQVMVGVGSMKQAVTLPLPTIEMNNIGEEKKGASISETLSLVLNKVLNTATQAVAVSGIEDAGKQLMENAKDAGSKAVDAGKSAVDAGKNAIGGLKSLFK